MKRLIMLNAAFVMLIMRTQALDLNCLQLPTTHLKYITTCCRFPQYKLHIYDRQCGNMASKSSIFGLNRYFHPCGLACVFNVTNLLINKYTLNMTPVYDVLDKIIDDKTFVRTYYSSFQKCMSIVKSKIDRSIAKNKTAILDGRRCSNIPIMYGICAHTETFLNCPKAAWSHSKPCNETKKYLRDCIYKV